MKTRIAPQSQPDDRLLIEARALLAADPAYAPWSETSHAADATSFDDWLDSPEGKSWLETEEEKAGSWWNHDGFNPEVCGHA